MSRTTRGLAAMAACAIGATGIVALPLSATAAESGIRINEVESSGGVPGDWIEFFNPTSSPVVLDGYTVKDDDDGHAFVFSAGTVLEPGGFLVIDELAKGQGHFDFGLGGADRVRLFDADAVLVDEQAWTAHASSTYGIRDDGAWETTAAATKGSANTFPGIIPTPAGRVLINEVDSQPADWVELHNTGTESLDLSGYEIRDDSDDHRWGFLPGTSIAPGQFLVVDEATIGLSGDGEVRFSEQIGIGGADRIRLFDATGALIDDTLPWQGHATIGGDAGAASLARCPDGAGPFVLAHPTPGTANVCVTSTTPVEPGPAAPPPAESWPGAGEVTVLDATAMFLEDSSGLDTQVTADGIFLWAVDNGTGRFWKLAVAGDGSVSFADGWAGGKRARFQRDASNPRAAGPDTEGITVADDGFVYLASERDNSVKGVNQNVVLQIDPDESGPDVVATREWDLTALLPAVGANLGIEAVEWISDEVLTDAFVDVNTGRGYDPASYPGHGNGLFFVAVEDTEDVYGFALHPDGTAELVVTIDPGLAGVMALDYDSVLGVLWAVCDNGCGGAAAQISFDGTDGPAIAHVARPAGMPDVNNEGFASAPASLALDGRRPAWWFEDGVSVGALRLGGIVAEGAPTDPTSPAGPTTPVPGTGAVLPGAGEYAGTPTVPAAAGSSDVPRSLAATGSSLAEGAVALAGILLMLGGAAIALRRRTRIG